VLCVHMLRTYSPTQLGPSQLPLSSHIHVAQIKEEGCMCSSIGVGHTVTKNHVPAHSTATRSNPRSFSPCARPHTHIQTMGMRVHVRCVRECALAAMSHSSTARAHTRVRVSALAWWPSRVPAHSSPISYSSTSRVCEALRARGLLERLSVTAAPLMTLTPRRSRAPPGTWHKQRRHGESDASQMHACVRAHRYKALSGGAM